MLRYSEGGLSARPALYAPYNDVTFIVEDVGMEGMYN
jgi:hypothetical protein